MEKTNNVNKPMLQGILQNFEVTTSKKSAKINLGSYDADEYDAVIVQTIEGVAGKKLDEVARLKMQVYAKHNITEFFKQLHFLATGNEIQTDKDQKVLETVKVLATK